MFIRHLSIDTPRELTYSYQLRMVSNDQKPTGMFMDDPGGLDQSLTQIVMCATMLVVCNSSSKGGDA